MRQLQQLNKDMSYCLNDLVLGLDLPAVPILLDGGRVFLQSLHILVLVEPLHYFTEIVFADVQEVALKVPV